MSEDVDILNEQAKRELRLTRQALKEMESVAYEALLSTELADDKKRVELISLINVCRAIPTKLQTHIDNYTLATSRANED